MPPSLGQRRKSANRPSRGRPFSQKAIFGRSQGFCEGGCGLKPRAIKPGGEAFAPHQTVDLDRVDISFRSWRIWASAEPCYRTVKHSKPLLKAYLDAVGPATGNTASSMGQPFPVAPCDGITEADLVASKIQQFSGDPCHSMRCNWSFVRAFDKKC